MPRGQFVLSAAAAALAFGLTNVALHPVIHPTPNVSLEAAVGVGESFHVQEGDAAGALTGLGHSTSATAVHESRSELDVLEGAAAALSSKSEELGMDQFDALGEALDSQNASLSSGDWRLDRSHWSFLAAVVVMMLSAIPVWFLLILERKRDYYHYVQVLVYDIANCTPRITPFAPHVFAAGSFLSLAISSYGAVFVSWWSTVVWNLVLVIGSALTASYTPSDITRRYTRADGARLALAVLVAQLLRICVVMFCPSLEHFRPALVLLPVIAVVLFVGAFNVQPVGVLSTPERVLAGQSAVAVVLAGLLAWLLRLNQSVGAQFVTVWILTAFWLWAGFSFSTLVDRINRGNAGSGLLSCGFLVVVFLAYRCFYELLLPAPEYTDADLFLLTSTFCTCLALLWACPVVGFLCWLGSKRTVKTSVITAFGTIGLLRFLYFIGPHHVYFPPDAETRSSWEINSWWGILHWIKSVAYIVGGVGWFFFLVVPLFFFYIGVENAYRGRLRRRCFRRLFRCVLRDDPAAMNGSEQTPGRRLRTPRFSGSSPPNTFEPPNSLIHTDAGQFVLSGPSSADEASDDETGNGDSANHSSRWSQQWSCPVCTFINPGQPAGGLRLRRRIECGMCGFDPTAPPA